MSTFRVLHLRQITRQPLRAALAAAAVTAAVAMTVAAMTLVTSLDNSTKAALRNFGGPAPIRVIGPLTRGGATPALLKRVQSTPGVAAAVPIVQAATVAQPTTGKPVYLVAIGVDCRIEAFTGSFGCDKQSANLRTDGPALISQRLASELGPNASIRTDVGRLPVEGALVNDTLDKANSGRVAVFSLATAQRVFERGDQFDSIYVKPAHGVSVATLRSRLERSVGEQNFVLRGTEPAPWMNTRGPLIPLLGLGVILSLALSSLLVYNIVSLSLAERRKDIAVASALGTSPKALLGGLLGETALLGLSGGVLGIVLGDLLSYPLVHSFASAITEQAMGLKVDVYLSTRSIVVGLLVGTMVGIVAAFVPARRALRLDLSAELHGRAGAEEEAPVHRALRLVVLIGASALALFASSVSTRNGGLATWQPPLGALAMVAVSVLLFAACGSFAPFVLATFLRLVRSRGGSLRVALANLVSRPRRTAVIATAIGAAVGLACVLGSLVPAIRATVASSDLGTWTVGRAMVATLPLNNASNVDARPSRELLAKLRKVPGVAGVDLNRQQEVSDADGVYSVRSIEGTTKGVGFTPVMGDLSMDALARGDILIGTSLARMRNLRPGSTLRIATPDGFVPFRVAGIWNNAQDNGYIVSVSTQVFHRLFGDVTPHEVFVRPAAGVSQDTLVRRLEAAHLDPDMYALTSDEAARQLADEVGDQVAPFWFLQRLLLFVALIGTLSTLLLVAIQRRREFGVLGAVGFSPGMLGRMTVAEAVAAGLAGGVLAIAGSVFVFEALRNAAVVAIGVRPAFRFDGTSPITALSIGVIVLIIGAALPAWRTATLPIVKAIRDE